MPYARRPRFDWDDAGSSLTVTAEIPQRPWGYRAPTIGSVVWSGSGLPVSYRVRSDADLDLVIRFLEYEWPDVLAFVRHAQLGNAFTFFPDANEGASYSCYLVSPAPVQGGASIRPQRQAGEFVPLFVLPLTIRRVDGGRWGLLYLDAELEGVGAPGGVIPGQPPPAPPGGGIIPPGGGGGGGGGSPGGGGGGGGGGNALDIMPAEWVGFMGSMIAAADDPTDAAVVAYKSRMPQAIQRMQQIWALYLSDPSAYAPPVEITHYGLLAALAAYELRETGATGPGHTLWDVGAAAELERLETYLEPAGYWGQWHQLTNRQSMRLGYASGGGALATKSRLAIWEAAMHSSHTDNNYVAGPLIADNASTDARIVALAAAFCLDADDMGIPYSQRPGSGQTVSGLHSDWLGPPRTIIEEAIAFQRDDGAFPYLGYDSATKVALAIRPSQLHMDVMLCHTIYRGALKYFNDLIPAAEAAIIAWGYYFLTFYKPAQQAWPYISWDSTGAPDLNAYYLKFLAICWKLTGDTAFKTALDNCLLGTANAYLSEDPVLYPGIAIFGMKHLIQFLWAAVEAQGVFAVLRDVDPYP